MPVKRIRYKNNLVPAPFIGTGAGLAIEDTVAAMLNSSPTTTITTTAPTAGNIALAPGAAPVAQTILPSASNPAPLTPSTPAPLTPSATTTLSPVVTYILIGIAVYIVIWLVWRMIKGGKAATIVNLNYN